MRNYLSALVVIAISASGCQQLNTFNVDAEFCYQHMLPLMEFSVDYPLDLETDPPIAGSRNLNYNFFFKSDEAKNQIESISLGYLSLDVDTTQEAHMEGIIGQMEESFVEAGFELEDSFTGTEEFDGNAYKMFRATGTIDKPEYELVGTYRMMVFIMTPEFYNNGLLITMIARDDSEIQSYADFASKGSISTVWSSMEIKEPNLERKE